MGAGGLVVWVSALHAEGRGFDSSAGTFPDFSFGVFAVRELIYVVFTCNTLGWKTVPYFLKPPGLVLRYMSSFIHNAMK